MTILEQYLIKICLWFEVIVTGCLLIVGAIFPLILKRFHILARKLHGSTVVITNPNTQLMKELIYQLENIYNCNIIFMIQKNVSQTLEKPLKHQHTPTRNKFYECNLTDHVEVKFTVKKIFADYGRIDIVIDNGLYAHTEKADSVEDEISGFLNQTSYGILTFLQLLVNFVPKFLEQGGGCLISLKTDANSEHFLASQPEIESVLRTFTQDAPQKESIDMSTIVCYQKPCGWLAKIFNKHYPSNDKFIAERIVKGIVSNKSVVKVKFHLNLMDMFCLLAKLH